MDHRLGLCVMELVERVGDACELAAEISQRGKLSRGDERREGAALHEFHGVERAPSDFAHVEDLDDVIVAHPGRGRRLVAKARPSLRVPVEARLQHLDGRAAPERPVERLVDDADGTLTEFAHERVAAELAGEAFGGGWVGEVVDHRVEVDEIDECRMGSPEAFPEGHQVGGLASQPLALDDRQGFGDLALSVGVGHGISSDT